MTAPEEVGGVVPGSTSVDQKKGSGQRCTKNSKNRVTKQFGVKKAVQSWSGEGGVQEDIE